MKWEDIAVIGMQIRVPEAQNPWQYFTNIRKGKVSISKFSQSNGWLGARGLIDDADCFDAQFFEVSEREATVMDPQHRIFLETVWQALEIAGYRPNDIKMSTALIASCSANINHWANYESQLTDDDVIAKFQLLCANDKDFLATRIAHKLNLRGPCFTVQSGCSSSALAVHQACRLLQFEECALAVAGGVSLTFPLRKGYKVVDEMIYSPSGTCRPYSESADGIVEGTGSGAVVLKRLDDAVNDQDDIWGVIKGSAVNNDGSSKMHFTAPSVDQQIAVIKSALKIANCPTDSVEYIEGHGTGTALGDAIELTALHEVYGHSREKKCYLGSVKANIGHLDAASGIVGLAKAILCLKFGIIPPQPGVLPVNKEALPAQSNLSFTEHLQKWESEIRRAAVSSLGIGGTNVHMVVENYPQKRKETSRQKQMFSLSAADENSVEEMAKQLFACLDYFHDGNLPSIASTLGRCRQLLDWRIIVEANSIQELKKKLAICQVKKAISLPEIIDNQPKISIPPLVFRKNRFPSSAERNVSKNIKQSKSLLEPSRNVDEVWKQVLGTTAAPMPKDHFFSMGGNSLTSIEFIDEINKRLDIDLSSVALYEYPTYESLLKHVLSIINENDNLNPQKEEEINDCYQEL